MEACNPFIFSFYQAIREDVQTLFPELDLEKDWEVLLERYANASGVQSLALLGKAMEKALITKELLEIPNSFARAEGSNLPELFYQLFQTIFFESGLRRYETISEESKYASGTVFILRQVLLAFSKLEDIEPSTDQDEEWERFLFRITTAGSDIRWQQIKDNILVARRLLANFFAIDPTSNTTLGAMFEQWMDNPFGRHGPGAVAGRETGMGKYHFSHIPGIPEDIYNINSEYGFMRLRGVVIAQARACMVPKDFRGRRIICIEPKELMFAQQGLMSVLFDRAHEWHATKRAINFNDQRVSQRLCKNYRYSTIDLKDASDSVSLCLLRLLFPRKAFKLLTRYRSRSIETPIGIADSYRTAFTMGNALCFPIETITFWALSLASMIVADTADLNKALFRTQLMLQNPTSGYWRKYRLQVFGDDIIVPKRYDDEIRRVLTCCSFTINRNKSCNDSLIREACGAYYYAGFDVRITRFRIASGTNHQSWISWASNAQELNSRGFFRAAIAICTKMQNIAPVPYGFLGLPGQRDISASLYRYNALLQRVEVRIPTLVGPRLRNLPGILGIYAYFTESATTTLVHGGTHRAEWTWTGIY